jgi:imidazolonepropionase
MESPSGATVPQTADLILIHANEVVTCRGPSTGVRGESALSQLDTIADGAVAVVDGRIAAVGTTDRVLSDWHAEDCVDARGRLISPGFVDPHSHLLFNGQRYAEYEARVTERARTGIDGGIRYSVSRTRSASDQQLVDQAMADLDLMLAHGTTTLEAKTGYGLDASSELRLLRLTSELQHPIEIAPTFLALHVPPPLAEGGREKFIAEMLDALPEAARFSEYCDVTADPIGFTADECLRVGARARELGMRIRVHADQTGDGGGAQVAARLQASAADHLDYTSDEGFRLMAEAGTVATLLPGVTYHLCEMTSRIRDGGLLEPEKPFMPLVARRAIRAGGAVALSTDYNPGTSPTPSMQTVMQLAARLYRLSYAEIWHMCTLNAAVALDRGHDRGSLEVGKRADLLLWNVATHGMAINRFGYNMVDRVWVAGHAVSTVRA